MLAGAAEHLVPELRPLDRLLGGLPVLIDFGAVLLPEDVPRDDRRREEVVPGTRVPAARRAVERQRGLFIERPPAPLIHLEW